MLFSIQHPPSGIDLRHSKALLAPHDRKRDSLEGLAIEDSRNKLINWQIQLLNLALRNKYAFQRWQTIVNVMILKEQNNHKIHLLRVIHLYEHDYNLILSFKWRTLITHNLPLNTLHPCQFGGLTWT
jgi:hypothetical protein